MHDFNITIAIKYVNALDCSIEYKTEATPTQVLESDTKQVHGIPPKINSAALTTFVIERLLSDTDMMSSLIDHYTKELKADVSGQKDSESVAE